MPLKSLALRTCAGGRRLSCGIGNYPSSCGGENAGSGDGSLAHEFWRSDQGAAGTKIVEVTASPLIEQVVSSMAPTGGCDTGAREGHTCLLRLCRNVSVSSGDQRVQNISQWFEYSSMHPKNSPAIA